MQEINNMRQAMENARQREQPAQVVADAVAIYQHARSLIDALKEVQGQAKELIADVFEEVGVDELKTEMGKAYTVQPTTYTRFDARGLEQLCQESDELAVLLEPYRSVTERKGGVYIR